MSIATMLLTVIAVLIFFGLLQRVLDRMYLTDRAALLLVGCMFVGTLLPNLVIGRTQVNVGGCLIPLGVCVYLLLRADTVRERVRACVGALVTAAAIYLLGRFMPNEPETMPVDPLLIYSLTAGVVACLLGRSRRGAFICGVVGVLLADVVNAVLQWSRGVEQTLVLGGAGLADAVVISGAFAVLITEIVGEIAERVSRKVRKVGEKSKT